MREKLEKYEVVNDLASGDQYYVFKNNETNVSIAYAACENKIKPLKNIYLYSFLSTRIRSELPFYVDAPFELATTRESIEFDLEKNQSVLNDISNIFADSLLALRDEGYIDQDFLNEVLPINGELTDRSPIYNVLYKSVKNVFNNNALLPTIDGGYHVVQDAQLYGNHKMVELENNIFNWIDINTSKSRIRSFLKNELDVDEVDVVSFTETISKEVIKLKNKGWLLDFYLWCSDQINWWNASEMKEIPFIRTRTGIFKSAYIGDEEQLFRPSNGLEPSQIINHLFTNANAAEETRNKLSNLLNTLGIKERTPRQTIEMAILSQWDTADRQERLKLFEEMWRIYNASNPTNRAEIVSLLRDKEIFPCKKGDKYTWEKGRDALRGNAAQRLIFPDRALLADSIWREEKITDESDDKKESGSCSFCKELGVIETFPITETKDVYLNWSHIAPDKYIKKYKVSIDIYPQWWFSETHNVDGFEQIVEKIDSSQKTEAIIELLKNIPEEYLKDKISGTGAGNCRREYTSQKIPAEFLRIFESKAWICVDKVMKKPYELSKNEFTKLYKLSGNEPFLELIGLRPDFIDNLPENERRGAECFSDLTANEMEKMEKFKKSLRKKEQISDKTLEKTQTELEADILGLYPALKGDIEETDDNNDGVVVLSDSEIIGTDTSGITHHDDVSQPYRAARETFSQPTPPQTEKYNKALCDLGEKVIHKILVGKYGNKHVNWFGGDNKGYDFSISENGEDILYIEVKTTSSNSGRIPITPSEWNMAKIKGDAYVIYVLNAKTAKYKAINNPFKQYLENKINVEVQAITLPKTLPSARNEFDV